MVDSGDHVDRLDGVDPLSNPAMDGDLGGLRRRDSGRVTDRDGYILLESDGDFIEPVQKAKDKIARGRRTLWSRIGPLRYGGIEISYRTEVWNEEREEWWRAVEVSLLTDGEPRIKFERKGTEPQESIHLRGSQMAELVADGTLVSKAEVNQKAEQLLETAQKEDGHAE